MMLTEPPLFAQHFWGDKHQGFDVMYHNMKHGSKATGEFIEFLRESCSIEDTYLKAQAKLAKQVNNYTNSGSFMPCWGILRQSLEKLSIIHMDVVQHWQTLIRDVQRYFEEQQRRHKAVKDGEGSTQEVVHAFQSTSAQLQKAKDSYHARYLDFEKARRNENSSTREVDRAENKLKKAQDEYKYLIEKYNNLRNQFCNKMSTCCSHFQEVEETHLQQMREFLRKYGGAWKVAWQEIGTMYKEIEQAQEEASVDSLLVKFVTDKGTGQQEPQEANFEAADIAAAFDGGSDVNQTSLMSLPNFLGSGVPDAGPNQNQIIQQQQRTVSAASNDRMTRKNSVGDLIGDHVSNYSERSDTGSTGVPNNTAAVTGGSGGKKKGGFFRQRRNSLTEKTKKKGKSSTSLVSITQGPTTNTGGGVGLDWRSETPVESQRDHEGFSIPPSNPWARPSDSDSSSSEEEVDDKAFRGIKVDIKPLSKQHSVDTDLNVLQKAMEQVRISPSGPPNRAVMRPGGKARSVTPLETVLRKSTSLAEQLAGSNGAFSVAPSAPSAAKNALKRRSAYVLSRQVSGNPSDDLFMLDFSGDGSATNPVYGGHAAPSVPARRATSTQPTSPRIVQPDPWGSPVSPGGGMPPALQPVSTVMSTSSGPTNFAAGFQASSSYHNTSVTQTMSVSQTNSVTGAINTTGPPPGPPPPRPRQRSRADTPELLPSWGDARGPSPAPLTRSDPLPLAVAFTETYHARFSGESTERRVSGELSMAFPAGILRHLTEGPQPLIFTVTGADRLKNLMTNGKIISDEVMEPGGSDYRLCVNMVALQEHLRAMREQNPSANYFNLDLIKYEVTLPPDQPPPVRMVAHWKCDKESSDFRLDYSLHWPPLESKGSQRPDVRFMMPVNGGVTQMVSRPIGSWSDDHKRATWRLISEEPSGNIRAKFTLSAGPGSPQTVTAQFVCEGGDLSGADFGLVGNAYRVSLCKRRLVSGKYVCESDHSVRHV